MNLPPRSLFVRMALVVAGGLVAAQVLSALLYSDERARWLLQLRVNRSGLRIADAVRVLDAQPPQRRAEVAAGFTSGDFELRVQPALPPPQALPDSAPELREAAAQLQSELDERLGGTAPAQVSARLLDGEAPRDDARFDPFATYVPAARIDAAVPSADGTQWYRAHRELPADVRGMPRRVLWDIGVRLAVLLVLLLIAVRWMTRPLSVLAQAADRFGRDLDAPPIPESGPGEVRRAAEAFNRMQARLRDLVREKSQMLAAVSHDLKTPLTRLRLRAEMLDDGELRDKIGRDLDEMESMVVSTLELMRGTGAVEPLQPTDLVALVESLQADYEDMGHAVRVDADGVAPLDTRPQALRRCLANLIDNGLKYGGAVQLRVEPSATGVRVTVEDDGPGIAQAELTRVFEPFYRVESSRNRETGGSGLGLSIARAIAVEHAGTLELANRAEGGLRATLELPRG